MHGAESINEADDAQQHKNNDDKDLESIAILSCLANNTLCRPDEVGRYLESTTAPFKSVILEPKRSIPKSRRIPFDMANNNTYIIQQRYVLPVNGTATALVEYNPTLLPLYT